MNWRRSYYSSPWSMVFNFIGLALLWATSLVIMGLIARVTWLVFMLGWGLV